MNPNTTGLEYYKVEWWIRDSEEDGRGPNMPNTMKFKIGKWARLEV